MVVVAIVGVLSAVALPQLTAAQDEAASIAAKTEAANAGKSCTIELITGDGTGYESPAKTGKVEGSSVTCAEDASFVYSGGGTDWTVTMVSGVAGDPQDSAWWWWLIMANLVTAIVATSMIGLAAPGVARMATQP